jgi:membrane protein DedA with SNARE-associated domain
VTDATTEDDAPGVPHIRPPRWVLPTALVPMVGVLVLGWVAGSVWPTWQQTHPLGLIALSPINRFLLLTTNHLDFWSYFGVGLVRHLFPDPFFYLLGYWYGHRALKWVSEGNAFATRLVGPDGRGLEDPAHRKILYPLAFLMPNNWVSLFCGASRIPIPAFIALNISGTLGRLILCRWLGDVFRSEIKDMSNFIADYQWPITAVSVVVVLIGMVVQLRPGGPIRRLASLDDEPDV